MKTLILFISILTILLVLFCFAYLMIYNYVCEELDNCNYWGTDD